MPAKESIRQLLDLPDEFVKVLLLLSLILTLAPYLAGHDFGVLKIPNFSESYKKRLRIVGPIALLLVLGLHVKFIERGQDQRPELPSFLLGKWKGIAQSIAMRYEVELSMAPNNSLKKENYSSGQCLYRLTLLSDDQGLMKFTERKVHEGSTPSCVNESTLQLSKVSETSLNYVSGDELLVVIHGVLHKVED